MDNEIYFRLIAGSLGAGTLLAFSLLVGLTASEPVREHPPHFQSVSSPVANAQADEAGPIVRTMATE